MASTPSGQMESIVGSFFFGEIQENLIFPFPHFSDAQVELAKEMTSGSLLELIQARLRPLAF